MGIELTVFLSKEYSCMKISNLILLSGWLFFVVSSCKSNDLLAVKTQCDFGSQKVQKLRNRTGTLIYYEINREEGIFWQGYFIENHNVSEIGHSPIEICNFPESEFPKFKPGDTLKILFEGRVVLIPEIADGYGNDMALSGIKRIK